MFRGLIKYNLLVMWNIIMKMKLKHVIIALSVLLVLVLAAPAFLVFTTNINAYSVTVKDKSLEYTGKEITPEVKLSKGFISLEEGEDFSVSYSDNTDVGKATVTVTGEGRYTGETIAEFEIDKAEQEIEGENSVAVGIFDTGKLDQTATTDISYSSDDKNLFKISENGKITPVAPGVGTVKVSAAETDKYKGSEKEITVEITETDSERVIRNTLEWAREIAADDSYTYGRGQCPKCHGSKKVYDCIAFMTASYWHGGKAASMERWCINHNHTSVIRQSMIDSPDWKGVGNPKTSSLEPGDVLFYYRPGDGRNHSGWFHVEIYNGNGQVVGAHTFGGKSCISVEPFNNYFRSYSDVYRYVGK